MSYSGFCEVRRKYATLCRRIGLDGETVLGQGNEAFDLYKRICPAWLEEESEGHETESYVYAQTVTGQASGELGHTKNRWITGTAFWTVNMVTVRKRWSLMGGNIIKQDILIVLLLQLKIGKHRTAEKIGYKLGLMLQFPHE